MKKVPWQLLVVILFFAYDDIWFTAEESPFMHYSLTILFYLAIVFYAIGQGNIIQ
jgi:hypothetical protein